MAMSYHFKYWQMHKRECHEIRSELQRMESESHQQNIESHRNRFKIHWGEIGPHWGRFEFHRGLLVSLGEDAIDEVPLSKADEVLLKVSDIFGVWLRGNDLHHVFSLSLIDMRTLKIMRQIYFINALPRAVFS